MLSDEAYILNIITPRSQLPAPYLASALKMGLEQSCSRVSVHNVVLLVIIISLDNSVALIQMSRT